MSKQLWNKIPFTDLFLEASTWGRIRNGVTKKNIKIYTRKDSGYRYFSTYVNEKIKTTYVHRCVMAAHNPINGYEKLDVNHIDFNPSNNKISNLEWCTESENMQHSIRNGRWENAKKIISKYSKERLKNGTHIFQNLTSEQHKKKYITRSNNYKNNGNHPNKGRFGLKGTNCKLTPELVQLIRDRHKNGEYSVRIAKDLNLSRQTTDNVIKNKKNYG